MDTGITAARCCLNQGGYFLRVFSSKQRKRDGDVLGRKTLAGRAGILKRDGVCDAISRRDAGAELGTDGNSKPLLVDEEVRECFKQGIRYFLFGIDTHSKMATMHC